MRTYKERTEDVSARVKRIKRKRRVVTGTCISLALTVALLVLFIPFSTGAPDVSDFKDSAYYDLIARLNEATYTPPTERNNFEVLSTKLQSIFSFDGKTTGDGMYPEVDYWDSAPMEKTDVALGEYVEVTDNQVSGVIEADIFKRSTDRIYYLQNGILTVYSIAGENSEELGSFSVSQLLEQQFADIWFSKVQGLYLSQDCTMVTIVLSAIQEKSKDMTLLVNLDVTDPQKMVLFGCSCVTGSYLSSRMVNGNILLMSRFFIDACDFTKEDTFLPQIGSPEQMQSPEIKDIYYPEEFSDLAYTAVAVYDQKTLDDHGFSAFLGYSQDVYVSNRCVYASRLFTQDQENGGSKTMTEIIALDYTGEELTHIGTVAVEGSVGNQYSMDEYDDVLRVVTSTSDTVVTRYDDTMVEARLVRNANLYCISLEDFSTIATVEHFAPDGETVESVRFDGTSAYVCTAQVIEVTDPVYFFDLHDLNNITWSDTGTIDGYSTSLIQLSDGYLMGVGYNADFCLKVEIYKETADGVISVCSYERDASFSTEYKSYLIDREKNVIGFAIDDWFTNTTQYILLYFNGSALTELVCKEIDGDLGKTRAFISDGYLYILCDGGSDHLVVEKMV